MYLSSENLNILLRSCLNVEWSWIGDVGNDQCWLVMSVLPVLSALISNDRRVVNATSTSSYSTPKSHKTSV